MSLAWHTAAFYRIEKLPRLDSLLTKRSGGVKTQSVDEQHSMLQMLSARLGIPLKRVRLIRKDAA